MIKRILSVVICVLMVAAVCAVSASAAGNTVELKVSANVTDAKPGDVIDYQVAMAPVSGVGSIQFHIDIPEGMTFVEGSAIDKSAIGFDSFEFTTTSMIVNGFSTSDYSSDAATVLANFKLQVADNAEGLLSVTLDSVEIGSCETFEVYETAVQSSTVAVSGDTPVEPTEATVAPTEAPTADTTTAPTVAPTSASTEKATTVAPTQKATTAKATSDSSKTSTATKDSTSPKTSDSGMIFVWIGLFALAILGVAGTFVFKKVRK